MAKQFALRVLIGRLVPKRITGKLLLKAELKKWGIDASQFPDQVLTDIFAYCYSSARLMRGLSRNSVTEDFVTAVKVYAGRVAWHLTGDKNRIAAEAADLAEREISDPMAEILAKYRIKPDPIYLLQAD
jgi:hypothetical protein